MRISRLFVQAELATGKKITLDDDSGHYLRAVLRLSKNAPLIVFNGQGGEYQSLVYELDRKNVKIEVGARSNRNVETPLNIHLGLGIARADRMDLMVQKAVELGVTAITPLVMERTASWFKPEKKQSHWQKIIRHAAEQCGRTYLPKLVNSTPLLEWLNTKPAGLKIFLDPRATSSLNQLHPENNRITLLTGPEGGFAAKERELAEQAGFIPVQLGARILRTETAALAALAAVQTLWGDFQHHR
jgi:16S rRNA (uracil1498-N3)-methyltransferase